MQLKGLSFWEVFKARLKKVIVDMTSVKFEFVVFVGFGIWWGKVDPLVGLPVIMATLGMKEYIDFTEKGKGVSLSQQKPEKFVDNSQLE